MLWLKKLSISLLFYIRLEGDQKKNVLMTHLEVCKEPVIEHTWQKSRRKYDDSPVIPSFYWEMQKLSVSFLAGHCSAHW